MILISLIVNVVRVFLTFMQLLMFGRAVMSWFPHDEESRIARFIFLATEPIVAPIRAAIEKSGRFQNLPIDVSFIAAFMVLMIVQMLLPDFR